MAKKPIKAGLKALKEKAEKANPKLKVIEKELKGKKAAKKGY